MDWGQVSKLFYYLINDSYKNENIFHSKTKNAPEPTHPVYLDLFASIIFYPK